MLQDSVAIFEKEIPDRPDDGAYLRASAESLRARLAALPQGELSHGMIHGDVIRANAVVGDHGQVTILDFDFCGYGWRVYDIASYLLTIRHTPQEQEFEKAFLEGYAEIRPLANEEKKALPMFEAIRAILSIGVPARHIEHWGRQYFDAFVDHDLAALECAMRRLW